MNSPILEVADLAKHFIIRKGAFRRSSCVKAVDGVSFAIMPQESFAVVGESGCGKTTLGKLILALERPSAGRIRFLGKDIAEMNGAELKEMRRKMQVIFQDPYSSLNPRMTVEDIITEPWAIHGMHRHPADRARALDALLDDCGIAKTYLPRYPHEFSGGQRQRVGIARALALDPQLIVADEPVSALDVSIQAQILNLLKDLQKERRLAYLFISHDLSVIRHLCTRIAVMYLGRLVEIADSEPLFTQPQHPYTEALLSAVPVPDPSVEKRRKRIILSGDVPSPLKPPSGCRFHPRCRYMRDPCSTNEQTLIQDRWGHETACEILPFKAARSIAALVEP
ncbi:MAG: oligopeptide/dipeptide ABC transporter ATP-binding protein [Elusimicrobiota bacterium]